ncbi:Tn3 family transposase [Streptosporangium sp. NBC_01756]|uniref:Tn3 family transposase n=1 Tax=Streptosporangium sp. NBC_01756 TaxID=2975950 RepID=UPI002DD96ACE|nr:Tn3 family transposase [Streptosporangium sp. NBC_01756]WSC87308.1 transposase [Streptosporangium sp. NBC_01756]
MGPAEAARHIEGITAHEISLAKNRHISLAKPNKAITDVVNAFAQLDVVKAWGDGSSVGGDLHHRRAAGQRLRGPAQDGA